MILQPHDLGDPRLFDTVADPDLQRRIRVDGAGIDLLTALFKQGQLFAGQHGFVEAGLPFDNDAVSWQGCSGQHPYPIADLQGLGRYLMLPFIIDAGRHDGHQSRQVGA